LAIFYEARSGEIVNPQIIHTVLTGITQHGKTEVIKSLIQFYQEEGFTILVIDVKDKTIGKPDFAEYPQIPIFLEEVTDPLSLLGLLESNAKMPLRFQFPELIKACQGASSLREIRDRLDAVITGGKIHPVRKDKAEVLKLVLDNLIEEIEGIHSSETLQVTQGEINCMNLSNQGFSDAFKQIAVRSVIRNVRMKLSKIFVIFDEAHIQIPEGYSSASKEWIIKTIKEGASSKQFLLIADQTIKEVDKNVITQCHFKIFGGQAGGRLEAQRTYDYIPAKKGVTTESIMTLPLGFFFLCMRDWTRLCYALPRGVPEEVGKKVAKGALTPEYVRDHFMSKIEAEKEDDEDLVYREKCLKLQKEVEELKQSNEKISEALERTNRVLIESEQKREELETKLTKFETLQKTLQELVGSPAAAVSSEEVGVKMTLGKSLTEINIEDNAPKEVSLNTEMTSGKLLSCAVDLHKAALQKDPKAIPVFTPADLQREAAENGWNISNMIIGKTLAVCIREGWLVREDDGFRLPAKLKINITKKA
jgi:hypothetical protein